MLRPAGRLLTIDVRLLPLAGLAARFRRSRDGIAVVEFAMILPILLLTYFGTIEIANVMSTLRKVDLLSRTVGDFVAADSAPTRVQVDDAFKSSKIVLLPYDGSDVEMVVSAVGVPGDKLDGPLRVCSSVAVAGWSPRSPGELAPVPIPQGLTAAGLRMMLVEIRMKYRPLAAETFASLFGQRMDGITFSRALLWPVRAGRRYASQNPEVVLPSGLPCPVQ